MAAAAVGCGSASGSWVQQLKNKSSRKNCRKNGLRVSCVSSAAVSDPYKTLRIHPNASESEVKKAFRNLALQVFFFFLHPWFSRLVFVYLFVN